MTDYVLMPGADYQNICDAVREKTGGTTLLRSGELAEEIQNIPTDGNDAFWDAYQQNGNRVNYYQHFVQDGWNDETFHPKYPIICKDGSTHGRSVFYNSRMTVIPVQVQVIGVSAKEMFNQCTKLETISWLVLENVPDCTGMFSGCSQLKNLNVEGSIGVDISFAAAEHLTIESMGKIIACLKDLKDQPTQTLTFHNAAGSKLSQEQIAYAVARNWTVAF